MNQKETPKYATLFYGVAHQLKISWAEYVLLEMVYHLSHKTGYCYKTASSIAYDMNATKRGVNLMIARLCKRGFMERLTNNAVRVTPKYWAVQSTGNKVPTSRESGNKVPKVGTKLTGWEQSTPKNNNENNKEQIFNFKKEWLKHRKIK